MTKSDKIKATFKANSIKYGSQTISIDSNWQILRVDAKNWEIQFNSKFQGFYGSLPSALQALPSKMLSEQASGTLADVLRTHNAILDRIHMAFSGVAVVA